MQGILCMGLISVITNNFVLYYQQIKSTQTRTEPKTHMRLCRILDLKSNQMWSHIVHMQVSIPLTNLQTSP